MPIKKPVVDHLPTASELSVGGVVPSTGSSNDYETGSWRTERPAYNPERCTQCFICWISCPDSSIMVENGKIVGIDAQHCKGCGICATECPTKEPKAIVMLQGGVYQAGEDLDRRSLEK